MITDTTQLTKNNKVCISAMCQIMWLVTRTCWLGEKKKAELL